jgi:hypothetical protein
MVRLSCIFRSFISHRSYIEANDSENPKPQRKIAGAFFPLLWDCRATCREINNHDAVNLQSLWN